MICFGPQIFGQFYQALIRHRDYRRVPVRIVQNGKLPPALPLLCVSAFEEVDLPTFVRRHDFRILKPHVQASLYKLALS